jgi:hypothetical protein
MKGSYAPLAYLITVSIFNFSTGSGSFSQLLSVYRLLGNYSAAKNKELRKRWRHLNTEENEIY